MRTLTRYVLRLHVAPFFFALTGLTLLLLLDQVSKRFGQLVGKGLHWTIIAEVFVYSIPFILAQTFPMAVLVAVLYVFNVLAVDSEITAISASGIPLTRLLLPLLLVASLLAAGMTLFNNTVLPDSNHRLQMLLTSIAQKRPTFQMREQRINEVLPSKLYVQVVRIDQAEGRLEDLVIYDLRAGDRSRTIYAQSAGMAYGPAQTDLYLTLADGTVHELLNDRPQTFQQTRFAGLTMRIEGITNELQRDTIGWRSDREMTIGQMQERVDQGVETAAAARRESWLYAVAVNALLTEGRVEPVLLETAGIGTEPEMDETPPPEEGAGESPTPGERAGETPTPEERAGETPPAAASGDTASVREAAGETPSIEGSAEAPTESSQAQLSPAEAEAVRQASRFRQAADAAGQFANYRARIEDGQRTANQFGVEIHKKFTIPAACIVFVLIGAPIAVRYPQGGVALVVAVSFFVFSAFYVGLVGGEELSDNRILSPFWAMWAPNVLFGLIGVAAVWRVVRRGR